MNQPPLATFRAASLGYGTRAVLAGVDLEIAQGSFWGVLGHNGSGKTTILKTLLGLIPCIRGKVEMRGRPRFGYVPQKEALDPIFPLTAYDVAAMGAFRRFELLGRLRGRDERPFIERCLADCGAAGLADDLYSALSSGQKQRVLIARALAAKPEILALDEPLAGIDATTQKSILELLKKIKEQHDLTVLMVSHRIRAEKTLFTDIAWVDEGRVTAGPSKAMLEEGRLGEVFSADL